jgi:hypothetical protein
MRALVGVPPEEAVAIRTVPAHAPVARGSMDCGRWRFAPSYRLDPSRAQRLAQRTVQARFLDDASS